VSTVNCAVQKRNKASRLKVIKESVDASALKIFVYLGGCTRAGIVLAELRNDPQRRLMLEATKAAPLRNRSAEFERRQ
jgi:hypothetical protein